MDKLEQLLKAKIPCAETGIEIKPSVCAICSPSYNCGISAYVKDGKLLKVEGKDDHPRNKGCLCPKGQANRQFVYREDRIMTPLRRTGQRGEGKFEPITWEEAYDEISERLLSIRARNGADAVAFVGGYNKWYRPWLRRFAHSFGTFNYGTESSTCMTAGWMAWKLMAGNTCRPDGNNYDLYLGWGYNPYYSGYLAAQAGERRKAAGAKFIVIDPRITPTVEKLADLHLRPWPGTDGALALTMANTLIQKGWIDREFIDKYVHGFDQYAEYVKDFNETNVEQRTGVPYDQVLKACEMIHQSKGVVSHENSAPIPHHRNGMQNYRAIISLLAITGNIDRRGSQLPSDFTFTHEVAGIPNLEHHWMDATEPKHTKPAIGEERFPLWFHTEREAQIVDLARQINEGTPYPIKALFAMGFNFRMLPEDGKVVEALKKLDFFVAADLFMTDTAKLADIVLPVCSSLERGELEAYPGGMLWYTTPAIDRVGQSKSDAEILQDLAKRMDLGDKELEAGYEANINTILSQIHMTVDDVRKDVPVQMFNFKPYAPGTKLEQGFDTPTGKLELYSEVIAAHPEWGLDPLPTYREPLDDADPAKYPFVLCSGGRLPHALHSRLHKVKWTRALGEKPVARMSLEDAQALGIQEGDEMELFTERGAITVTAQPSFRNPKGVVFFYHGYSEADVNSIMSGVHVDPYSGFPAYRSTRCGMRKKVQA